MVNSIGSQSSAGLLTAMMKDATTRQEIQVSVIKKAQDVQKMQGEAALKLIDSAASAEAAGRIDVRV